jgi:CxxC-x17-CxxC domain-containing protein
MADYNRDRNGRPGGGFRSRPSFEGRSKFSDRGNRGPAEMFNAVCDSCGNDCQVPFRPTNGKPVYCSNCFQNQREGSSESRNYENRSSEKSRSSEDHQMFDAICDECGNKCQVPFQPRGDKPIYCSNCFGEKKGAGSSDSGRSHSDYSEQLTALNGKLDQIIKLLSPEPLEATTQKEAEAKIKPAKKKSPKINVQFDA